MKKRFNLAERALALVDGKSFRAIFSRAPDKARMCAFGLVAAFHVAFLGVIAMGLRLPPAPPEIRELHVSFLPEPQPTQAPPSLSEPALPMVEPPQIVIADDAGATLAAVPAVSILAPRPDPVHPNDAPRVAHASGSPLVLKLLILNDGSVGDAQVATSSGDAQTDADVLAFIKEHWRFLPAMLRDTAIQYWTTVAVPLRAGR